MFWLMKSQQRDPVVNNLEHVSIPCVSILCVVCPKMNRTESNRREEQSRKRLEERITKKPKYINNNKNNRDIKERISKNRIQS